MKKILNEVYDWTADMMNSGWDPKAAKKKLKDHPDMLVCDALLDQNIFAGVGNIIKNEVLFRIRVQPEATHWRFTCKENKRIGKRSTGI